MRAFGELLNIVRFNYCTDLSSRRVLELQIFTHLYRHASSLMEAVGPSVLRPESHLPLARQIYEWVKDGLYSYTYGMIMMMIK